MEGTQIVATDNGHKRYFKYQGKIKRDIVMKFKVSKEEQERLHEMMREADENNMSEFIRKKCFE